jgi:hypothetical protein
MATVLELNMTLKLNSSMGRFGPKQRSRLYGSNPDELRQEFQKTLDYYLKACKDKGAASHGVV